jgi:hypothetical protein
MLCMQPRHAGGRIAAPARLRARCAVSLLNQVRLNPLVKGVARVLRCQHPSAAQLLRTRQRLLHEAHAEGGVAGIGEVDVLGSKGGEGATPVVVMSAG